MRELVKRMIRREKVYRLKERNLVMGGRDRQRGGNKKEGHVERSKCPLPHCSKLNLRCGWKL
jgi:hypothetical protein